VHRRVEAYEELVFHSVGEIFIMSRAIYRGFMEFPVIAEPSRQIDVSYVHACHIICRKGHMLH